ncbi:MAG: hypothetical protein R3E95_17165 [Thiolinea sp.]
MPEKITATYRITTPMFIGDADQQASTISPAAFKGPCASVARPELGSHPHG